MMLLMVQHAAGTGAADAKYGAAGTAPDDAADGAADTVFATDCNTSARFFKLASLTASAAASSDCARLTVPDWKLSNIFATFT